MSHMGSTGAVALAQSRERSRVEARARFENGVVIGDDDTRAAALGRLQELPSLGEVLDAWREQIERDACEDYAVDFRDLLLAADGRLDMGVPSALLAEMHGTDFNESGAPTLLPMTYRTFGNLIRDYCNPPRNSARNLIDLPRAQDPHAHTARTMRQFDGWATTTDSPRAHAYNARLDVKKRADQPVFALTGEPATIVLLRSRVLRRYDESGKCVSSPRVIIGNVTPTHSLRDGDDDKLISAITLAFAGHVNGARGAAYRGVEESELRVVFPALTVRMREVGAEEWAGYITARNSESGAKSWSVSAGLYRQTDGASIACEALIRTGRHVGHHVAERMVEVAEGAAALLNELALKASELSAAEWPGTEHHLLMRLRAALEGTALHDGDTCCGIAFDLGRDLCLEGMGFYGKRISIGTLINVLGRAAAACARRVDARPVEVMLGRMLVHGWFEFKAAGTEQLDDGAGEE